MCIRDRRYRHRERERQTDRVRETDRDRQTECLILFFCLWRTVTVQGLVAQVNHLSRQLLLVSETV